MWHAGDLGKLMMSGGFGQLTAVGWALTLALGPFAAVQLWRMRESGRRASLALASFALLYYVVAWSFFRQPGAEASKALIPVVENALFSALLLSSPTRRICQ
jgi:hypothetical protein